MITIAMEMALPAVLGLLLDQWLGTSVLFTIGFSVVGLGLGMWHLMLIVQRRTGRS